MVEAQRNGVEGGGQSNVSSPFNCKYSYLQGNKMAKTDSVEYSDFVSMLNPKSIF